MLQLIYPNKCDSSSIGGAPVFYTGGWEFEPLLSHHLIKSKMFDPNTEESEKINKQNMQEFEKTCADCLLVNPEFSGLFHDMENEQIFAKDDKNGYIDAKMKFAYACSLFMQAQVLKNLYQASPSGRIN